MPATPQINKQKCIANLGPRHLNSSSMSKTIMNIPVIELNDETDLKGSMTD